MLLMLKLEEVHVLHLYSKILIFSIKTYVCNYITALYFVFLLIILIDASL